MQPQKLGRYEIVRELGRGAMGRVFLAHDPQIDRKVALKTVLAFSGLPAAEHAEARERFLGEARAAGKLLHPGIVTLFDVGEAEGTLYLAMEWVEGRTLDAFCRPDDLLPVRTACELIAGVAETLDFAHASGIVHRDIKPANLMRVGETSVKVMDFGLARAVEAQVTHAGALMGTPSYMSPEQIRGGKLDGRSDLFSLAVVLFELLTGDRPFPGDSVSSIIYRIVHEPPREAAAVHERVPRALGDFLTQALAKEADERFPTGEAFAASLRVAAGDLPAAAEPAERRPAAAGNAAETVLPPALTPRRRRSSSAPLVGAALAVIVLLAGAGWIYRDRLAALAGPGPEVWWQASVRTEPAGLPVTLDGAPLDEAALAAVRFRAEGPFPVLATEQGCRRVERALEPADAGGEVVLVAEPTTLAWRVEPGTPARVRLNGSTLGSTPLEVQLDLCADNELQFEAAGYRPATVEIPAGVSQLEARSALTRVELEKIPVGRLVLPAADVTLIYYLDGKRLGQAPQELELPEGEYEVRLKNETYWIDERRTVRVEGDRTVEPDLAPPPLGTLVVQAFPANCKVFLRRPGERWQYVDDTPSRRRLAAGRYEVRVTLNPTGETQERKIDLSPGENPPVRVSFARRS